jgi:hypothetical protein
VAKNKKTDNLLVPQSNARLVDCIFYEAETGEPIVMQWPEDKTAEAPKGFSCFPKSNQSNILAVQC